MKGNKYYQKKIQELRWSKEFQAQLLSRMIFDCENFCGYGCGQTNLLWAGSIERQIGYMHAIVQNIGEDIITDAQVLEYENKMKDVANRMRYVHLYEVDTLITQMKVGFYSRIPEWSSDHKEISTDYAILIPYMEKDSAQMQLLSMEQIYEKLGIKNEVKKNTKVFDQIYLTSLSDRVKNAIENDKVFIDLENEQAWYVQLDNNPDDSVTPFIRGDGCYTHVFGQFRYYPKSCAKLDRKEQFQAIQRELLNKLLDMVRENLDRFVLNDSDQGQFFFESQTFHWELLDQYRKRLDCFLDTPTQCSMSKMINGKKVTKKVTLWGNSGELSFTIENLDYMRIVGKFIYEDTENEMDVLKIRPFKIQNIGDEDFPSLVFQPEPATTQYVMKCADKYRGMLIDFLSQQKWVVNGNVAQTMFRKDQAPIWLKQAAQMVFDYPTSITCRSIPTETGPVEYFCLVSRTHDLNELF